MDLLRAVLQPSFNNDIMAVFMKYQKVRVHTGGVSSYILVWMRVSSCLVCVIQFYEKAAENVKENVGMEVQTDHLIREAYRNALEHVRSLSSDLICSPVKNSLTTLF